MKLDLKRFCALLSMAKETQRPDEAVNRYLLDHVLMPALNGIGILIGDIDFSRFDAEDIDVLAEYYETFDDTKREFARFEAQMGAIPPMAGKTRAFC